MSDDAIARALYGGAPEPPAAPTATPPVASPLAELAQRIYGPSAASAAGPDHALVHGLFDQFEMFRSNFASHGEALHDRLGLDAAVREQDDRAFLHLAKNELGLSDPDVIRLHGMVVGALAQAAPDAQPGESAESRVHARNSEIRRILRAQVGEGPAGDLMKRTEAWIAKHPELQQLIESDGIATSPDVFLLLAQHVRDNHIR